jgi:hypothetical protein
MTSKVSSLSLSITGLLMLSAIIMIITTTDAYATHHGNPSVDPRDRRYCIDYHTPYNGITGSQCEPSKKTCEQRLAEYQARDDLIVLTDKDEPCYRADIQKLETVYCIDYRQDHGGGTFSTGAQCETSREACEQRMIEYQEREDIEVLSDECYRHEKEYRSIANYQQ